MKRAFLIAEAGMNHEGDLAIALTMVREASEAGCDAIKFQAYRADKLVTATAATYWHGGTGTQQAAFQSVQPFGEPEWRRIAQGCREWGIEFIVTPFHVEDVAFFAGLCDRLKIASGDITNRLLLEAVVATKLPVLVSTGGATYEEIMSARSWMKAATTISMSPTAQAGFLHCVLSYPTAPDEANLTRIARLKLDGYSDHTVPPFSLAIIEAAYVLGATVIEKHFTLDRGQRGNDHYHSFERYEFNKLRVSLDRLAEACEYRGEVQPCEEAGRIGARRSWTSKVDIPAGTTITEEMVTLMRPGNGLQP